MQLAVAQANAADSGYTIELEQQDDGSQESIAQSALQQILATNPTAIVGTISTAVCLSTIDTIVQAEVPMIAPACTSPQLSSYKDDGYFFRTAAASDVQGAILAQLAYDDGARKVAMLSVNNSYGQPIAETFTETFEGLGGTIAYEVAYDATAKTFTAETQQAAAADPDSVILIGYQDTGAAIVYDASQRGLLDIPWYTGDGIRDASFPGQALPGEEETLYTWKGVGLGSSDSDATAAFAAAYEDEYSEDVPSFAPQSYDAAWIAILASVLAENSGETARDEIANVTSPSGTPCIAAECLELVAGGEAVAYQGATGAVEFDEDGNPTKPVFAVWQFSADGLVTIENIEGGK